MNWKLLFMWLIPVLGVSFGVRFTIFDADTDPVEAWGWFWAMLFGGGIVWASILSDANEQAQTKVRYVFRPRRIRRRRVSTVTAEGDE